MMYKTFYFMIFLRLGRIALCCTCAWVGIAHGAEGYNGSENSYVQSYVSQPRKVSGTISDEFGEPMIGVSITESGTTNGYVTDVNGNFELEVAADAVLAISYTGYKIVQIDLSDRKSVV